MDTFADRLLDAIDAKGCPVCVGIDPVYAQLPEAVAGAGRDGEATDPTTALDAIFAFTTEVLQTVAPLVPVVKFQSAYFERYRWDGIEAYHSLIAEARDLGLLTIGDVKRGDIGSTSAAYAAAHLSAAGLDPDDAAVPDAITLNPMLGMDTLVPFIDAAKAEGRGLFVLVRTSNPGSADFQDVALADGRTWSELVADKLAVAAEDPGLLGRRGISSLGAVVGATQAHTMQSLRRRLPRSPLLLPGYGTQGATADMTRAAFEGGRPALVSASRSILYAHADKRYAGAADWREAVRRATVDMRDELAAMRG